MTDYFESRKKLVQGENWRGEITVTVDGDEYSWTSRQLNDEEFFEVISDIDRDAIGEYRDEIDQDKLQEYRELQDVEDPDEDEQERLEELRNELEDESTDILDAIDEDTFNALQRAGIYGAVPSEEDVSYLINNFSLAEVNDQFDTDLEKLDRDTAYDVLKEDIKERLRNATRFVSFEVGLQILSNTLDTEEGEGNSKDS